MQRSWERTWPAVLEEQPGGPCSWSRVSQKRLVGDEVRDLLGQGRFLKALQIVEGTLIFALGEMGNYWKALGIGMP